MPANGNNRHSASPAAAHLTPRPLQARRLQELLAITDPLDPSSAESSLAKLPYEILEACLLHLPTQDLLLCQRICHRFRDIVATSRPIRRALFLEPTHQNGNLDDWKLLTFNPFLATQLAASFNIRVIGVHRGNEGVKMVAHMRYQKEALVDDDWADILLREEASWKSMLVRVVSRTCPPG